MKLVSRLAPSPTGALHLGNARTFLINWVLARRNGWSLPMRIEDLDGPRIKIGADKQAIDDLAWLGLIHDGPPVYQSARLPLYAGALDRLIRSGAVYPCICTHREVETAASAPHAEDGSAIYPGTCRDRFKSVEEAREFAGRSPSLRFRVPDETVEFVDRFKGRQSFRLGDFVIAKGDATPAYQLAVVVDDLEMSVTNIVRADDLLESTARQILIYRALDQADRIPSYWHFPLVLGPDGRRLAKRHGDTRLAHYRGVGVGVGRVLALLARWCGIAREGREMLLERIINQFEVARIAPSPITFTAEDDAFLRS